MRIHFRRRSIGCMSIDKITPSRNYEYQQQKQINYSGHYLLLESFPREDTNQYNLQNTNN